MKKILMFITAVIVIAILFITLKPQNIILKKIYKQEYGEYVYKYANEYNLDPLLIFAIIKNESKFEKNTKSSSGAIGLMQLMETTAIEMANQIDESVVTQEELYNPEKNIRIGTKYFAYLLKHYNDNQLLALTAYNAGMGNVDKWIKEGIINKDGSNIENIPYKETNNYVRKIVRDYKIYKEIWK